MAVPRHVFALTVQLAARAPLRLADAAGQEGQGELNPPEQYVGHHATPELQSRGA